MVFSDTTNKLGLIQACEDYCDQGDGGISSNATLLKQFTRLLNVSGSKIWHWIFMIAGGWHYDDSNQTDLPQATQNLVSGTGKYALPTTALTVVGVEYLNATDGTWTKLVPITEAEWMDAQGEFNKNSGLPSFYMLKGDTIILDMIPNISVTSGFKVYFDRGSVAFASTDTTKTPGFASEYHNAQAVGASLEWLKIHKPTSGTLVTLREDWKQAELDIKNYYANRFVDDKPAVMTSNGIIYQ